MFETRFTGILRLLQTTMGNHVVRHDLYGPLLVLLWNRLSRTIRLFERLVTLWRAGTLPKPRKSRAGQPRPVPAKLADAPKIPRTFAWLLRLSGGPAAIAASQLRFLMSDSELRRFLAECPRAGRLIRPICHMTGMRPSEVELAPIRLPPRPRKPRPPKPRPPRPESRTALLRRLRGMTGAELHAHFHPIPPHFPLPIPGWRTIRRKIAEYQAGRPAPLIITN